MKTQNNSVKKDIEGWNAMCKKEAKSSSQKEIEQLKNMYENVRTQCNKFCEKCKEQQKEIDELKLKLTRAGELIGNMNKELLDLKDNENPKGYEFKRKLSLATQTERERILKIIDELTDKDKLITTIELKSQINEFKRENEQ